MWLKLRGIYDSKVSFITWRVENKARKVWKGKLLRHWKRHTMEQKDPVHDNVKRICHANDWFPFQISGIGWFWKGEHDAYGYTFLFLSLFLSSYFDIHLLNGDRRHYLVVWAERKPSGTSVWCRDVITGNGKEHEAMHAWMLCLVRRSP